MATRDNKWVTIGSYNVNDISAYASVELNMDVNDPEFAAKVQQRMEAIIAEDCTQVTEKVFLTKYNFFQRSVQYFSYLLVRVIFYLFTFYFKQG
jgi:cardiolipin synthase